MFTESEQEKNEPLDENKEKITKKIERSPYYLMKKYCENNKYEFLVHIAFLLLILVLVIHITPTVFCIIEDIADVHTYR